MRFSSILVAAATAFSTAAVAQVPVEAFAEMPMFKQLEISPDGQKFFTRINDNGTYRFMVVDISGGGVQPLFSYPESKERTIGRAEWARNDRIVLGLMYKGQRGSTNVYETRLIGMDPDGTKQKDLFPKNIKGPGGRPVQLQDQIVSTMPQDPGKILVQYFGSVYAVNIDRTAVHTPVRREWPDISYWQGTRDGEVFAGWGVKDTENFSTPTLILLTDGNDWVSRHHLRQDESFDVIGPAARPNIYYVISSHEGRAGLYEYDAKADQFGKVVYSDPDIDVDNAVYDDETRSVLGVVLAEDENDVTWLSDNWISAELAKLKATFPDNEVAIYGFNETKTHAIVKVNPLHAPGQLFIYDRQTPGLTALPVQQPSLQGQPLGKIITTSFKARDGLDIPAYVTLPPGLTSLEQARNLPFVVYPHGGPHARDYAEYDFIAQMLASQGYGVLQMNFRGSSGYGREFLLAGKREWGQAMQDDITDGAQWLVSKGYAANNKLAILGGSYGGYAALMGAAKTPDLYQCAIGLNGVYDLPQVLASARQYMGGRYSTRFIGDLYKDRSTLNQNSPINLVNQISVPVLLVHGQKDNTVNVDQSRAMAAAMQKAGANVRYVELPEDDHYLSFQDTRLTFLQESERFLESCLGQ
ncbi:alpha/beta hydrolase family protein [Parvularcula sp. LCG005]|uniref:alpha/beta hydrolase family protein n=1 Tax=Parvularcula sp. LCG005 TaxID=3078805 RepID=UPI002941D564|nr:prolyl oligopeptidase family serine peptidase [Parvularcula sp. LCG005]WOI54494.1 prolyl oligopeptidase family serine peptidase [Parvularcula sp. LCG005]